MKVRFIGSSPAEIWDTPYVFKKFGQIVELPDDLYQAAVANRMAIVPVEDFDALFTAEDLKSYWNFGTHATAKDEFKAKLVAIVNKRFGRDAGTPVEQPVEVKEQ